MGLGIDKLLLKITFPVLFDKLEILWQTIISDCGCQIHVFL